jgi:hypothetical protein
VRSGSSSPALAPRWPKAKAKPAQPPSEFDLLINKDVEDVSTSPEAYQDVAKMLPHCLAKKEIFKGLSVGELQERVPRLDYFVNRCTQAAKAKHDAATQAVLAWQAKGGVKSISTTIKQAPANLLTTLGWFFWLVDRFKSEGRSDVAPLPVGLEMLLSPTRIQAFGRFLLHSEHAPQTIRNRMIHISTMLGLLWELPLIRKRFAAQLSAARKMAKHIKRGAASNMLHHQALNQDRAKLVQKGKMFASPLEHNTFNRWCLAKFAERVALLAETEGELTLLQASRMQAVVATLLMDFSCGQRCQVVAELTADGINWCKGKNWEERQLTYSPGLEKVSRRSPGKLPLPNFLQGHVAIHLKLVRPVLLCLQYTRWHRARRMGVPLYGEPVPKEFHEVQVKALWISHTGGAMSPPGFTKMLSELSTLFNPDLHLIPRTYRYTYISDLDGMKRDWDSRQGDVEECVASFVNVRREVQQSNYDRNAPLDKHVRVQEAILRGKLERLHSDIRVSISKLDPLLKHLAEAEWAENPQPEHPSGPGRRVRTVVDDAEWATLLDAEADEDPDPLLLESEEGPAPSSEEGRALSAAASVGSRSSIFYGLRSKQPLIQVTSIMRRQGQPRPPRSVFDFECFPAKKIVAKGRCVRTNHLMYEVEWQNRDVTTWEEMSFLVRHEYLPLVEEYELKTCKKQGLTNADPTSE